MLAKLDNLGPFHLFFTLSCADLRWDENFAAILQDKYDIKYKIEMDDEGNWDTKVTARNRGSDLEYKPLKQFIEEDVEESQHELIRGNVLIATRYYQQRVKNFICKIAMGANNPMNVKYYTYKVEFQDRGAGHIHGTLWLDMDKLEDLVRDDEGTLRRRKKEQGEEKSCFKGLKEAFKKLRNNTKLESADIKVLRQFIDTFTSVSTHGNTVGREVARIAQEVNKHHHTKTCRKYDKSCRFNYPRYPTPQTIIVKPCEAESQEAREAELIKHQDGLEKVRGVLENEELMKNIMHQYKRKRKPRMST